ncbi:phage tail assembly protein [Almyronema epifaneia]|uniref:Phage tail assembly protein n=1 Tax=Almyronema epifaneia S1 TaxID=2991925 RepID=A0ABW6IDA0_9CYAN
MVSFPALVTEFEFTLPRGLIDETGQVHRQGKMRLATGRDELAAQRDRRTVDYPGYLSLVLLSQVITQLGTLTLLVPEQLENLFTQDLAYLKEFYNRVNQQGNAQIPAQCPQCGTAFEVELVLSGES